MVWQRDSEGEVSVHSTVEQEGSQGSQSSTSFTAVARPFLTVSVPVLPETPVTASYARIGTVWAQEASVCSQNAYRYRLKDSYRYCMGTGIAHLLTNKHTKTYLYCWQYDQVMRPSTCIPLTPNSPLPPPCWRIERSSAGLHSRTSRQQPGTSAWS